MPGSAVRRSTRRAGSIAPSSASVPRATARPSARSVSARRAGMPIPASSAAPGTPFQKAVWRALTRIPYGETASYGDIARAIGKPAASRAIGSANHRNPIAIVIPCHRVIGADGSMTGYGGGLDRKRLLLSLEARRVPSGASARAHA